jgi:hypothetical protein
MKNKFKKSLEGAYDPRHPVHAIIDNLKGVKSSYALNFYPTLEDAVDEFIKEWGVETLKIYLHDNGYDDLINDKMKSIFDSIEFIATV